MPPLGGDEPGHPHRDHLQALQGRQERAGGSATLERITGVGVTPGGDGFSAKLDPYPLEPSKLLAADTSYKAIVTTGAKDVAGNGLDQDPSKEANQRKAWSFTTGSSL